MRNSIFFVLVAATIQSGCGAKLPSVKPFKMEVQQGNVVTSKMLLQLRPGMTRSQVRYIMGTPLIVDSFRNNRWDYFYELRKQGVVIEKRRVILDFDKDNLLAVRGDVIPSADNAEIKTIAEVPKVVVDESAHWTEKLKFWKGEALATAELPVTSTTSATTTSDSVASASTGEIVAPTVVTPEQLAPVVTAQVDTAQPVKVAEPAPIQVDAAKVEPAKPTQMNTEPVKMEPVVVSEQQTAQAVIADLQAEPSPVAVQVANNSTPSAVNPQADISPVVETSKAMGNDRSVASAVTEATPSNAAKPSVAVVGTVVAAVASVDQPKEVAAPIRPEPKSSITRPAPSAKPILFMTTRPANKEPVKTPVAPPAPKAKPVMPAPVAEDDDEIVPFIPEGEYQGPGPTPDEMQKGNAEELVTPVVEAATQTVTEKGVAPTVKAEVEPVFVSEQLPEPAPEPEADAPVVVPPAVIAAREKAEKAKAEMEKLAVLKAELAKAELAKADATKAELPSALAQEEMPEPQPATVLPSVSEVAPAAVVGVNEISSALPTNQSMAPVQSASEVSKAQIQADVSAWAQAWRSKNINAYLAAYANDFLPEGSSSKPAWEAQRRQRLSAKQGDIRLVLNNVTVAQSGNQATVSFEQQYASKTYRDQLNKTLQLRLEPNAGHWLIVRELTVPQARLFSVEAASAKVSAENDSAPSVAVMPEATNVAEKGASKPATLAQVPDVKAAVDSWLQAWQRKDITAYLAAYAQDFMPEGLPSRQAWVAQRKTRLSPKQGAITVEIRDVVIDQSGNQAKVSFHQKYSAKAYRDEMQKTLQLRLDAQANVWLIVKETSNTETAKKTVTAPEGSAEQLDGVLEQVGF